MNNTFFSKLKDYTIGDRFFYRRVLLIVFPIIIQNTITHVVNLLDNVMVGRVGTLEMSAVAIVNQLLFVFNLCVFGGLSGVGIFATQFAGAKDDEGVRHCFRLKVAIIIFLLLIAGLIFGLFPVKLMSLYLAENTPLADAKATIGFGLDYLKIMLVGLIPFSISQVYSGSLRETGETKLPMYASIAAIFINIGFNYLLIFGKMGFPALGVKGAAIATVFARVVEMVVVVIFTHIRRAKYTFIKRVYRSMYIPATLFSRVFKKGMPVLVNEFFWSMGMAFYLQCYSVRGLEIVAAANIASTINNLFSVVLISISTAVAIMVGQYLGANEILQAKRTVWRLSVLAFVACTIIGGVLALLAPYIPHIYNTEAEVKHIATSFLYIVALMMPFSSFTHNSYFTIRAGGKTIVTFLFDSGFLWFICAPLAFFLANYTDMHIIPLYFWVMSLEVLKCVIGFILLKKGIWISNIVK
ncbi:MAG: MATE family efflux transporter [Clostridia bacterium]|nr:MATE family efflux transporter [Clostridia bacterium]